MKPGLPLFPQLLDNATAARAWADMDASMLQLPVLPSSLSRLAGAAWQLSAVTAVVLLLLAALRAYLDNGGVIPLGRRCAPFLPH